MNQGTLSPSGVPILLLAGHQWAPASPQDRPQHFHSNGLKEGEKHLILDTLRRQESPQHNQRVPACSDVSSSGGRCLKKTQIKLKMCKHNFVQSVDISWKSWAKTLWRVGVG